MNGYISRRELKAMFSGSEGLSNKLWKKLIKEVDLDGDGQISFVEFEAMLVI